MESWVLELKVFLLEDIESHSAIEKIAALIDSTFDKSEYWKKYHKDKKVKEYCFNSFYPVKVNAQKYNAGEIYTVQIRTISKELKEHFMKYLKDNITKELKGLIIKEKEIKYRYIDKLVSVTPTIIKTENGYWRENITLEEYENRLKLNIIKKYNSIFNEKIDENIDLFIFIEFKNKVPVKVKYKNINLLGDKLTLGIAKNETAQKLAFLCLSVGLGEMNARGFSYMNPRWV